MLDEKFKVEKKLERFSLNVEYINLLEKEAIKQGKTKGEMLNHLLYESLVKRDNRLSNHIARMNEDLLLMLLLKDEKEYETIEDIFERSENISRLKSTIIKEKREIKKTNQKNFWNEILSIINTKELSKLKDMNEEERKETSYEKILKISNIIKKYMEVLNVKI